MIHAILTTIHFLDYVPHFVLQMLAGSAFLAHRSTGQRRHKLFQTSDRGRFSFVSAAILDSSNFPQNASV